MDADPVLRHFAVRKKLAIARFEQYVKAGIKLGRQDKFYETECGILGSEEFVDSMIHRIGEHDVFAAARRRNEMKTARKCDTRTLLAIVEKMFRIPKEDLCSRGKSSQLIEAKEVLILSGRRLGASLAEMSDLIGINGSTVSRRHDAAKRRMADDHHMSEAVANVIRQYELHKG